MMTNKQLTYKVIRVKNTFCFSGNINHRFSSKVRQMKVTGSVVVQYLMSSASDVMSLCQSYRILETALTSRT